MHVSRKYTDTYILTIVCFSIVQKLPCMEKTKQHKIIRSMYVFMVYDIRNITYVCITILYVPNTGHFIYIKYIQHFTSKIEYE